VETDATFGTTENLPKLSVRESLTEPHRAVGVWFTAGAVFILGGLAAVSGGAHPWLALGVAAVGVLCWAVAGAAVRANRRALRYGEQLRKLCDEPGDADGSKLRVALQTLLDDSTVRKSERAYHDQRTYLDVLRSIVEDGVVDQTESTTLSILEELLELDQEFLRAARLETFREVFLEAVADRILDPEEEAALGEIQRKLEVPDSSIEDESHILDDLRQVRRIRQDDLPVVETSVKLHQNEVCHYEGQGRILKSKILQRIQRDGVKYKLRGLEVAKEGQLLVTSKRVLLIHEGTSTVPHSRIMDLEVDVDQNLLTITKDGVVRPVYLTTPDSMLVGALIASLAGL
jgi:hypothetical protein